ncbi:MAG: ATP-grasp domain-containing protein [Patescibacteria group bacterium]
MTNQKPKIAIFFGGKISRHLRLIKEAAEKLSVDLDLVSYNQVRFDTKDKTVWIGDKIADDYDVLFFRTTGKHWEEVNLVIDSLIRKDVIIVDPLVRLGAPSRTCKAHQMVELAKAGIGVPVSIYGSLKYLRDNAGAKFGFPLIIKGSAGDRGTRVFKADNQDQLNQLFTQLRPSEIKEGRRYLAQEFIDNDGDYRLIVLGDKVLGVMKRFRTEKGEFRNNFSCGGEVKVTDLPDELKDLAIKASRVCQLLIAGVDIVLRNGDPQQPIIWEVNKTPQFTGFMKATGIDVPREIVKFLLSLCPQK